MRQHKPFVNLNHNVQRNRVLKMLSCYKYNKPYYLSFSQVNFIYIYILNRQATIVLEKNELLLSKNYQYLNLRNFEENEVNCGA